jgi:nitrogen regulatory protein PII
MKQVIAFIKPHQLSRVVIGLRDIPGLTGVSISKGQGFGRGRARSAAQRVVEGDLSYVPHARIEVFCGEELVESVVAAIAANAHTGLTGDGKIYVCETTEAVRISNGERGAAAV